MGISGLLPLLKPACKPAKVQEFKGQTFAVDVYCFLHKGAFGCAEQLVQGKPTEGYIKYVMKYVNLLLYHDIKPILVFDGRNLPSKAETEKKRREARRENREKAVALLREGRGREAKEYFQRCVDITPEMALGVIKAARERNVDCIVAPYEADAELAFLSLNGLADVVVTEDSDLTLFGCEKVLFKLLDTGDGVLYEREHLGKVFGLQADQFSFERFRYMCITSGCDYLASLPGIGLGKAKNFWQKVTNPDVRTVLRKLPMYLKMPQLIVTQDYIERFVRANNTFLYQLVFDPQSGKERPLTLYPESLRDSLDSLSYCGSYSERAIARQMALGNVNIFTMKQVDNFDPDMKQVVHSSKWGERAGHPSVWCRDYFSKSKERREKKEKKETVMVGVKSLPSGVTTKSKGVERKRKSEVTEEQVESILDEMEEEEESKDPVPSPPRKKTKLSEVSKFEKVVGLTENKSLKISKFFGSKKNQKNESQENPKSPEVAEVEVRGRRLNVGESGSWFQKIDQPTSSEGKFIYSTEQEIVREEIVLREISNSLEDTPENLMRRQRRNPFAVGLQARRLSEDLVEEDTQSAIHNSHPAGRKSPLFFPSSHPEGQKEVQRSPVTISSSQPGGEKEDQQSPLVIPSSQLSLYSIDGESLTFSSQGDRSSQSPVSTQPLSSSPEDESETLSSQSSHPSSSAPRVGLSRSSGSSGRGGTGRSSGSVSGSTMKKTPSLGTGGPRLGLSRGGGRKQATLMEMFGRTVTKAKIGPSK